jgi:hypothetical protein
MRSIFIPLILVLTCQALLAQTTSRVIFDSKSKDGLVHRLVYADGDYCHVREYASEESSGLRISYLVTERIVSIPDVKSLITRLANQFVGKREKPLILKALQNYREGAKDSDHWLVTINNPGYSEFYISVDWFSESVSIQIKYAR